MLTLLLCIVAAAALMWYSLINDHMVLFLLCGEFIALAIYIGVIR